MLAFVAVAGLATMQGNFHPLGVDERLSPKPFEAGTSPAFGLGGILEQFPPSLYPENPAGPLATSRLDIDTGKTSLRPGPQEIPYLNLYLPTHIDHDGAVVSAASVRVRQLGGVLSESEMNAVLRAAGWPTELVPQALRTSYGESRWSPYASGDNGNSLGIFQLNGATWGRYCGVSQDALFDALVNAQCAYLVYLYDVGRGYRPWTQWSVKWESIVLP